MGDSAVSPLAIGLTLIVR